VKWGTFWVRRTREFLKKSRVGAEIWALHCRDYRFDYLSVSLLEPELDTSMIVD
jgi:hypothetical protein